MATNNYIGLMELAHMMKVPFYRIIYAHKSGAIPFPARILNRWAYALEDVERVRSYFAVRANRRGEATRKKVAICGDDLPKAGSSES
jgi:hypothetical protein